MSSWDEKKKQLGIQTQSQPRTDDSKSAAENWKARKRELGLVNKTVDVSDAARGWMERVERGRERGKNPAAYDSYMQARTQLRAREFGDRLTDFLSEKFGKQQNYMDKLQAQSERESSRLKRDRDLYVQMLAGASYSEKLSDEAKAIGNSAGNRYQKAKTAYENAVKEIDPGAYYKMTMSRAALERAASSDSPENAAYQRALELYEDEDYRATRDLFAPGGSLSEKYAADRDAGKQKYEQDVADEKTRRLQIAAGAVPNGSYQAAKLRSATKTNAKTRNATQREDGVTLAELYQENKFNPPGSYELENNYSLQGVDEDIFYALYNQSPEKAKKWVAQAKRDRDEQRMKEFSEMAGEDTLSRAAYLIGGTALDLAAGVANFLDPHSEAAAELKRGAQAVISGGAQGLTEKGVFNSGLGAGTVDLPLIGEKGLGDLYQLGSSMLASGAIAASSAAVGNYGGAASAVVGFLGTSVLGSSAAVGDYEECLKRGMTRQQASSHAFATGVAEAAFEYISLDKLVNQDVTKGFLKNFFQQGGIEASEELCTTIANRVSDGYLARRDGYDTQIEHRIRELMALGVDRKEAEEKAEREWLADLVSDGLGGFISGGVMTAGSTVANLGQYTNVNRYNEQAGKRARESGEIEALKQYAENNELGWYGAESSAAAEENASGAAGEEAVENGAAQETTPKSETHKQKMQDRQTGSDISRIQAHMEQQFSGKSVQEQQELASALIEQYGEKISPAVYEAVTADTARSAAEIKDADTMLAAKKQAIQQAKSAEMRQAIRDGYDLAAFRISTNKENADFAARYLQQSRNSGTTEMRMEAIVKDESGNEKAVKISGFAENGKSVRLENGKTVDAKKLQSDADTVDAVRQIAALDLGKDADAVLQAYLNSGETEANGYRWVMDYATAYEQGRTNRISLKEAVSRSSLNEDAVMEAYALGQKNAHAETQRRMERIKSQPAKEGLTGKTAKIDISEISGKTLNSSELEQFDFANKLFELVGVDVKWFASGEKNGKFVGKNGAYENGTVYLDVHAGRNFLSDVNSGILATTTHELTHFLQQYAPEQYQALKEFVLQQIVKSGKNGEMRLERLIWEKQRRSGEKLSRKAAEDEVAADACQTILRDSKAIHEFAKQDAGAVKGIARWLDGWFKKLKKMFDSSARLSEEAQIMENLAKNVRKAFGELWDEALKEAVQTHDRVGSMENQAQNSDRSATDTAYLEAAERGDMETIRFSMRDPVETTDRLIAWHNMSEDALRSALELGGLAMPSWAIKTADRAHTSYGTVSVIAPRSLVDPKMNKKSMIFAGDAWTPVFPDVNYKISSDAVDALTDEIEGLIGKDALHDLGGAALDETNIADQFSKNGGTVSNYYKRNQALRYAYLKSIGQDIELPKTAKRLDDFGKYENDAVENFASRLVNGKKSLDYYRNMSSKELMQDQDLKNAITDTMVTMYGEEVRDVYAPEELSFSDIDAMLHAASKYFSEGIQEQLDSRAVGNAIDKVIDEAAYEKWIGDKLNATIERKGIRNNKDPFTPSGKRRSFDELNYAYNLANIVKAMKAQPKQGRTQFLSGPGSVKGAALKNYSTVEQVRADRGRLVNTAEEGKAAYDEYNDNLADILDRMGKNGDRFDTADALIEILQHAKTEDAIYRYMERELKDWYNVSRELAHDIYKLIGQINELPMEYFEGKTYDAVGFDETAAVVVPDSIDPALKRRLAMAGANVVEYRDGDNEDRLEKVNSVENVQFSERDYSGKSDLDLLEQAAEDWTEERWQDILKNTPELAGQEAEVRQALQAAADSGRKVRDLTRQVERLKAEIKGFEGDGGKISAKQFRSDVLDLFSIPAGERTGIGAMLDDVTDYLAAGNKLQASTINMLFERMVRAGKQRIAAEESLASIREEIKGRVIYVNQSVREEFGDDWNSFRQRAFGLGITLTGKEKNLGIDAVNAELAELYPGSFDANATDMKAALENIVDTAESGKTSTVSTLEAMLKLQNTEGISVEEQLRTLLDQFTQRITAYEQMAALERKARSSDSAKMESLRRAASKAANKLERMRETMKDARSEKRGLEKSLREMREAKIKNFRQLAKEIQNKKALQDKLEKQLERERKILSGQLKPPALQSMLKAERKAAAQKMAAHKEEVFAGYKERKEQTALRGRISSLKSDLKRRLSNPTDRSYVPAELATALVDALDAIDNSPKVGAGAAAAYQSVSDRLRTLAAAYELLTTDQEVGWEYKSEYDEEIKKQISDLAKAMQGRHLKELTKTELEQVYDLVKSIRDSMRKATKLINATKFADVYEAMKSLVAQQADMTPIADANWRERRKRLRLLSGLSPMRAVEMMSNWDRNSALYQLFQAVEQGAVDASGWIMGYNKRLQTLKTGKNEKAYRDSMTKLLDFGAVDKNSGKNVRMTKMQAIQLLMTWQREQASNGKFVHLQKGGAVIRDALAIQSGKSKKANSRTIAVTPELIQRFQDSLTDWDRSYMAAMREYLKQEGKATNRVLYDLKHRVLPLEENYMPYSVDKAYLETRLEGSDVFNLFVKTPGSTNDTQTKAPQPVIIDGLDTFMTRHAKDMANYIGLAIPIRDFAKVFNGRLASEDGGVYTSVKKTIEDNFGEKGNELILQALLDVQGGTKKSGWSADIAEYLNSLQGAFVRSALLVNPSVTMKQAASYIAAESVISHKALELGNRALLSGDKSKSPSLIVHLFSAPEGSTAQRLYNEIDAHTSMHWERRQGMSYSELADQAQRSGAIQRKINAIGARMEQNKLGHGLRKLGESLDPLQWIQRMDVATTATLWVACKEQAKIDGLKDGSQEFWTRTTELYERCLRETQPMYDGLHRTAVQKMSGGLMQYLFPFRTVPIQNHGQLVAAYEAMKASKGKSKAEQAAAKKHFAKTVWAQTESAVVFSLCTMLAAGLKRKTKKYRDKDEEITTESVAKGFGSDVAGTLFSVLLPVYGSELWTIGGRYIDKLDGETRYTYDAFSVGVVDMLNELAGAGDDLFKDAGKAMRGEEVKAKDFFKHLEKMLLKGAKLVGIPAETVKIYAAGLTGNLEDFQAGRIPAFNDESWERSDSLNANRYFNAWIKEDKQKASDVLNELLENTGGDEDKARDAINGVFNEAYNGGKIRFAEYERFVKESGLYDAEKQKAKIRDLIRDAYVGDKTKEFNRIGKDEAIKRLTESGFYDSDDAWKTASEWEETAEHSDDEDFSYSQYGKIYESIDANKDIKALVSEYAAHGYEKNSITSGIKSHLVENFVKGQTTEEKLKNQLSRYCGIVSKEDVAEIVNGAKCKKATGYSYSDLGEAYRAGKLSAQTVKTALIQYGGLSGDDAKKKLRWYDLQKANPKLEISEDAANSWYDGTKKSMDNGHEGAQSAGMSISDYLKAKEILSQVKGTDGNGDGKADSGTKEVAYIQALAAIDWLTDRQRAALYYEEYKGTSKTSARPFRAAWCRS